MPKILITADIHAGLSGRLDDILWSFRTMEKYMLDNSIDKAFINGDLFNDRSSIMHDVANRIYDFFKNSKEKNSIEWITFPGNHDMFNRNNWEVNALKSFSDAITVYNNITNIDVHGKNFHILPFIYDESLYMDELNRIIDQSDKDDVIMTHIGVNNASLNECFLVKNWSIVSFNECPLKTYAGHFHCHQRVPDTNVYYPGSPIPFNFTEGVVDHGFIIHDTDDNSHEFIKIFDLDDSYNPPDFITITSPNDIESVDFEGNNVRIMLDRVYEQNELSDIRADLTSKGVKSVSWMKMKEKDDGLAIDVKSVDKFDNLLSRWLEKDNPSGINLDSINKINEEVVDEGNELYSKDISDA